MKSLTIDLTRVKASASYADLGLGTTVSPHGQTILADGLSLLLNGERLIPAAGEFHYSRYPAEEWEAELQKMKAGGISVVATYVFWIHHEEREGEYDWSGQRDLKRFLKLCQKVGLKAIVRIGPWAHGEVRNGGFPDWVQNASYWAHERSFKSRGKYPEFLDRVKGYFAQIAKQLDGCLWKQGGPVVGIQLDNECWEIEYLLKLKQIARSAGIDVPLYTMTGWNAVPIPEGGLVPLFGGYADGFWEVNKEKFKGAFFFSGVRDEGDLGAISGANANRRPERNERIKRYPYLCCEIGGGMPSSYHNRIHVLPDDIASCALVKLGNGNNLPGYYMYQGGTNPDGKLTTLNESRALGYPNDLQVKDYDFEAPLSANGLARQHFFLLRRQHLFLQTFGGQLASMGVLLPDSQPTSLDDVSTLRWCVRTNGTSGFLFFNNHQRNIQLPAKPAKFEIKSAAGTISMPKEPVQIPTGAYGFWPLNLEIAGIKLSYATAEPLFSTKLHGEQWVFFAASKGIDPEFAVERPENELRIHHPQPGLGRAFTETAANGGKVNFVVLPYDQGSMVWPFEQGLILSPNLVYAEAGSLIQQAVAGEQAYVSVFDPSTSTPKKSVFRRLVGTGKNAEPKPVKLELVSDYTKQDYKTALDESAWESAQKYKVRLPGRVGKRLLRIKYQGDALRVVCGGRLVLDHFWNGQPVDLALWRLSAESCKNLEIRVLPWQARKDILAPASLGLMPKSGEASVKAELLLLTSRKLRLN